MSGKIGFLNRFVAAQERRMRPFVNEALSRLDDQTLIALGHDPSEVRARPRKSYL
ncbi:hypothetical protein MRS76_23685 [Rhizobiaceae bacterium n13]|uniref:Uncharacterized protein n=1 Tax=Ferirhizobium litorale TaxID=2927786 RepID=A0AAE3QKX9_9HYPH|nr:hypothetical protein [Fererhizobium litorale]MDI7864934.1 hypothetical protein [Fererhizobium litorale]MDI7925054.1 hypothetical protein [Fererhizobium litorale]